MEQSCVMVRHESGISMLLSAIKTCIDRSLLSIAFLIPRAGAGQAQKKMRHDEAVVAH